MGKYAAFNCLSLFETKINFLNGKVGQLMEFLNVELCPSGCLQTERIEKREKPVSARRLTSWNGKGTTMFNLRTIYLKIDA